MGAFLSSIKHTHTQKRIMADVNFIKSTPGLLMILEMVGAIVAIACGATAKLHEAQEWNQYIFSASCITLILIFILFLVIVLQKLWDEKLALGCLFLCAVLMIVAVVLIFVKSPFINSTAVAYVITMLTTVLLIVHILVKLGFVKA